MFNTNEPLAVMGICIVPCFIVIITFHFVSLYFVHDIIIEKKIQNFHKVSQYILKSLETFLIRIYSIEMPKKSNKTRKARTTFVLTTDSLIEKY